MSLKEELSFSPATFVPPKSPVNSNPSVIVVGEQPGKQEVKKCEPFVGPAGELLNEIANEAGIQRYDLYLTNVMKDLDASIDKYFKLNKGNVSLSPRGREYVDLLKREVLNHDADIIIAIGNVALYALLNRVGITKWRGSKIPLPEDENKIVVPILHPATVLPPKFQYLNRHLIKFDFKKVKRLMTEGYQPIPRNIVIEPSFDTCMDFLHMCKRHGEQGFTVYYDLEIFNEEVSCISFSTDKHSAISIPFIGHDGDYFPPNQEAQIWRLIAEILENPQMRKGGQNIGFDAHFLLRRYGIKPKNLDDTMVAEQIILPDYKKGLDFITSIWTDHPYYKDEGKRWFKVGGAWRQLWHYNATDSIVCAEAFPNQWDAVVSQGNAKTYERQRLLIEPLVFMQEHGIRVDVEGIQSLYDQYQKDIREMEEELTQLAGRYLNPRSPDQLKQYFYKEKGFPAYKDKGSVTTNDLAMKRLIRKGSREAELVRDIRSYGKLASNYLDPKKIDPDGRLRCSYNPVGTRYSRISSAENIFGTGMNMQNWPHKMQRYLLPDEGHVFYSFDLSQAENRIVAYVGRIHQMIEAFESGKDVHSLTGALISGKSPEEVKDEDKKDIKCPIGSGDKTWRDYGKRANHCKLRTTEVLTPSGWMSIEDAYIQDEKIAQWNWDYSIKFVQPSNWHTSTYSGTIYKYETRYVFQEMTLEHRVPIINKNSFQSSQEFYAPEIPLTSNWLWPCSGYKIDGNVSIPPLYLRLIVAFQADGTFNYHSPKWKLKNVNKINRLKAILEMLETDYTERGDDEYTIIYIKANTMEKDILYNLFKISKNWPVDILQMDKNSLEIISDEVLHWDGFDNSYFTSIKHNADIIQTVFHLCGYRSLLSWGAKESGTYRVSRIDKPTSRTHSINKSTRHVENEPIFCPTVESGFFLCRENDVISVTSNSLNYGLGYKNFALQYEIPEKDGKFIVDSYHNAYPGLQNGYHSFVKKCLAKSRTLENLMGRKTIFLGAWDDDLFKEAYSCIPQGTTGDVINERGLIFIYYNQNQFRPIKLLNQVHDSIGFQISKDVPWTEHARMLLEIKNKLETPLTTHYGDTFVIPADLTIGCTLYKEEHGEELKAASMPDDPDEFASMLEYSYNRCYEKTYGV